MSCYLTGIFRPYGRVDNIHTVISRPWKLHHCPHRGNSTNTVETPPTTLHRIPPAPCHTKEIRSAAVPRGWCCGQVSHSLCPRNLRGAQKWARAGAERTATRTRTPAYRPHGHAGAATTQGGGTGPNPPHHAPVQPNEFSRVFFSHSNTVETPSFSQTPPTPWKPKPTTSLRNQTPPTPWKPKPNSTNTVETETFFHQHRGNRVPAPAPYSIIYG